MRSTFRFFFLNSPRPLSPGSEGDLVSEAGELLVCSCDLSEMGERICSLLMIRDIRLVLGPAWAEAGLRSRDEDEVTRSEGGPELGTPLVTLSLMLSAAETFTFYLIFVMDNVHLPSLVFDSTLSILEIREEQPELAILLSILRTDLGWNMENLGPLEPETVLSSREFLFRSSFSGA